MAELFDVVNAMLTNRSKWVEITNDEKDKNFFIVNRYMSKLFPDKSQLLNNKSINKVTAMDTWYLFMLNKPYPKCFWSKSSSSKTKPEISDDEILYLTSELDLKEEDIEILMKYYPDVIKEEITYYRNVRKANK